jgi:hypothetical protein
MTSASKDLQQPNRRAASENPASASVERSDFILTAFCVSKSGELRDSCQRRGKKKATKPSFG